MSQLIPVTLSGGYCGAIQSTVCDTVCPALQFYRKRFPRALILFLTYAIQFNLVFLLLLSSNYL